MSTKIILILIAILVPTMTFAQNDKSEKGKKKQKTEQTVGEETTPADSAENKLGISTQVADVTASATEKGLSEILAEKQQENKDLKKSIQEKSDSIKYLIDSIAQLKSFQKGEIKELKDSINTLNKENKELKNKTQALASLSHVVYKQCLLYPLERKYNKKFVDESLQTLKTLDVKNNARYKEICDTYWDLLEEYSRYNQEILTFLTTQYESFSLKQWNITDVTKGGCKSELEKLSYYSLYKKKDIKPWKSIIYLDNVIDDLIAMLSGKKNLNEANFKDLITRVTPKS